jgi:uncharacterized membrane protein (UPF0127 family)
VIVMEDLVVGWIVHDTRVVASANIATTRRHRRHGMKAFPDASVPLVIERCRWVHSFGMRFALDVAHLDATNTIVSIRHMEPNRPGLPVARAVCVVEAEPGAFSRWGLAVGDTITIRGAESKRPE